MRIRAFAEWSVKLKLLFMTAGVILCSVFLVSALSYLQYTKDFERQSSERIGQIIDQLSINIDTYLDDLFRLSLAPYQDEAVMNALERSDADSKLRQLEKQWLVEQFMDSMMIVPRKDILGVLILTDTVYYSGRIAQPPGAGSSYRETGWYRQAMRTQEHIFVPSHLQQQSGLRDVKLFSIVKQLRSITNTERVLGVIKVDANYRGIEDIADRVDMGRDGGLYVLDDKGSIIYASAKPRQRHDRIIAEWAGAAPDAVTVKAEDREYLLNSVTIPRANWTVLAVNSVEELNREALQTRNIAFAMAIVCSLFAIAVVYVFVKSVMNPLLSIVKLMGEVERGNLSVRFGDRRKDEIGYLGSSFNELVARIKDMLERNTSLVKEVYEAQLLQKEAQVQALYNQIRPHFIFNTLNLISLSMQSGMTDKAVDHIEKLGSILRGMTVWDRDIPISREIQLLDAYLSIQSSRYDGRLAYAIDIPKSLHDIPVPALLFQPIVENAVIHGCERKRGKTTVRISAGVKERRLIFVVTDDGNGMDGETLERLRAKLREAGPDRHDAAKAAARTIAADAELEGGDAGGAMSGNGTANGGDAGGAMPGNGAANGGDAGVNAGGGTGIGLVNVHRRIQFKYGQTCGLTVESAVGKGTTVILTLPFAGRPDSLPREE